MMPTPSLRNRVVAIGVVVVVVVLATTNGFLYLLFQAELARNLDDLLHERAELVRTEATHRSEAELVERLTELGIRATVRSPDGTIREARPPSPSIGRSLPGSDRGSVRRTVSRDVPIQDGAVVTVFATRSGVDDARGKLLFLNGAGLLIAALLAALLLRRASGVALRPLDIIAESARRTSAGQWGERLRPDRPGTPLGQLAGAYDDMLDTLEAAAKRASQAQMESELHYLHLRQIIETAQAAFITMDRSGTITDWNRKAEEMFGWTEKEAVGRLLGDTIVPPAVRPAHEAGLRRFLDTGDHHILGKRVEVEALHRDGRLIPVELAMWVTYVGEEVTFSALLYDVTERRKGEEAIGRLASIVESAQEAILSTSLDGTILTWNLGAERIYSYRADEIIGRNVSVIVPADRRDEITDVLERARAGRGIGRYETVRRRKDGSEVEVAVTSSPIFDAWGSVVGASLIARDITEQRRLAISLYETLDALQQALDDARHSDERSRRFLADAAHQLRSPVAGVRACAETLLRATGEHDRDALLADLVRETARAGRLISSLLRLAHVDQGVPEELQPCDVLSLCQSEVDRTRVLAPELRVSMHAEELPDELPVLDRASVCEILSNLLDNARRHAATTIRLGVGARNSHLEIVVADDGSGIPEESVDDVFERFVSLDGKGGSGLGLPIARDLARRYGGDLTYESRGFLLTLPLQSGLHADDWMHTESR
jgi:PAS domain S-box-containing protein